MHGKHGGSLGDALKVHPWPHLTPTLGSKAETHQGRPAHPEPQRKLFSIEAIGGSQYIKAAGNINLQGKHMP